MSNSTNRKPCEFPYMIRGKIEIVRPIDSCRGNCESCGWNPAEQKRRLEQGAIRTGPAIIIRVYAAESDKRGKRTICRGLRSLMFPPKYSKGKGESA